MADAEVPVADHVKLSRCSCGTVRLHLFDAAGQEMAVAPFDPMGAIGLAISISDEVEIGTTTRAPACVGRC